MLSGTDVRLTYWVLPRTPPRGFHKLRESTADAFPGVDYATVRAFAYRQLPGSGPPPDHFLSTSGMPPPSAIGPGTALTPDQVDRLLKALRPPPRPPGPSRSFAIGCGFNPHHAFVFYDDRDRPLAELQVCFGCGEVESLPTSRDIARYPRPLLDVHALCRELRLAGCPDPDEDTGARNWQVERAALIRRPDPSSVALGPAASRAQSGPVCQYAMTRGDERVGFFYVSLDKTSFMCGKPVVQTTWERCFQQAHEERHSAEEVLDCLEAWGADPCFERVETRRTCAPFPTGVLGLHWDLSSTPGAPRAPSGP